MFERVHSNVYTASVRLERYGIFMTDLDGGTTLSIGNGHPFTSHTAPAPALASSHQDMASLLFCAWIALTLVAIGDHEDLMK